MGCCSILVESVCKALNKSTTTWPVQPLGGKCGWKFPKHSLSYKPCSFAFSSSPNATGGKHHSQIHETPVADLVPTTQKLEKAVCDVCGIFLAVKPLSLYRGVVAPHREDSWLFQVGIFERDAAVILLSIPLAGNESFAGAVDASVLLCLWKSALRSHRVGEALQDKWLIPVIMNNASGLPWMCVMALLTLHRCVLKTVH